MKAKVVLITHQGYFVRFVSIICIFIGDNLDANTWN